MQFQLEPHQTSKAVNVVANSAVVITPAVGATARVEYTTDTTAKIQNGTATWTVWSYGTVTTATRDVPATAVHMRVTAELGEVVVDIHLLTDEVSSASVGQTASISGAPSVGSILTASLPKGVTGTLQWTRTQATTPFTKSNISGAVANAVNSLAYTVQSADAGYTLGCDASSTVSASTGVAVPAPAVTLRNNGTTRMLGTQAHLTLGLATNALYGSIYKVQAPGPAIGVRIAIINNAVDFSCASYRVAVAPTDIAAIDTKDNAWSAQIGGTLNNAAYNATTKPYGFRKGTFGGLNGSRRPGKGNAVLPSLAYNNQEDVVLSDKIDLPATPIRATDRAADEYYFIVRVAQDCVANVDGYTCMSGTYLYPIMQQWVNTNGADSPLLTAGNLGNVTDAVNTYTGLPVNPPGYNISTSTASNQMSGQAPMIAFEWIYPTGVTPITFWNVGDSITESYNWNRWAIQRKNTNPQRPLHIYNLGGSTTRTESFLGNMYLHLQNMAKPDHIMFPLISPNNYTGSLVFDLAHADMEYDRLVEMAQFVQGLGIKLWVWTPTIFGGAPTTSSDYSTPWFKLYNRFKTYAAANNIVFVDFVGDARCNRTVYNSTTNPGGWIDPDATHPSNPTGQQGQATIFGEYLTAGGF